MKMKSKVDNKINRWKRTGSYTFQKKLPNKDNRMIYGENLDSDCYWDKPISKSEWVAYSPIVRVPSLKRKSAWKRFYKLFPGLKGKKIIHGSSQSFLKYGVNASTIKLKKVKK